MAAVEEPAMPVVPTHTISFAQAQLDRKATEARCAANRAAQEAGDNEGPAYDAIKKHFPYIRHDVLFLRVLHDELKARYKEKHGEAKILHNRKEAMTEYSSIVSLLRDALVRYELAEPNEVPPQYQHLMIPYKDYLAMERYADSRGSREFDRSGDLDYIANNRPDLLENYLSEVRDRRVAEHDKAFADRIKKTARIDKAATFGGV